MNMDENLVNKALYAAGQEPLIAADRRDRTAKYAVCRSFYIDTFLEALSEVDWVGGRKRDRLVRTGLPVSRDCRYRFAYDLPFDCGRPIELQNNEYFVIEDRLLLTDAPDAELLYVSNGKNMRPVDAVSGGGALVYGVWDTEYLTGGQPWTVPDETLWPGGVADLPLPGPMQIQTAQERLEAAHEQIATARGELTGALQEITEAQERLADAAQGQPETAIAAALQELETARERLETALAGVEPEPMASRLAGARLQIQTARLRLETARERLAEVEAQPETAEAAIAAAHEQITAARQQLAGDGAGGGDAEREEVEVYLPAGFEPADDFPEYRPPRYEAKFYEYIEKQLAARFALKAADRPQIHTALLQEAMLIKQEAINASRSTRAAREEPNAWWADELFG